MSAFNCLSKEAPLFGSYLLEASAGTGKTFAIEQIAVRLLIEKEGHLLLEEILIVTFTRRAAADLKKRILSNIEKTIRSLSAPQISFDDLPEYLSDLLSRKKKEEILRSLQEALLFFDRSQIFTIHGFCSRMLQEFAFEAREASVFSCPEGEDEEELRRESFFDLLYYEDVQARMTSSQLGLLLKKFQEPKRLFRTLQNAKIQEGLSAKELLEKMQETLSLSPLSAKELLDSFETLFPHFKISSFKKEDLFQEAQIYARLVEKKQATFADLDELLKTRITLSSFLASENKKVKGPSFEELVSLHSALFVFQEKLSLFLKKATSSSHLLSQLAQMVDEKMEKKLEQSDRFTFDRILKKMKKALDYQEFAAAVRGKYRAVMIDEFQDTDPLQWEIFRRLFLEEHTLGERSVGSFFLVGDPKQSIYRFRKADLYTYYEAAAFLGKEAHFFLDTNYRSTPQLVASINALFSHQISSSWLFLPELKKDLPYHSVKSGLIEKEGWPDGKRAIHFFIAQCQETLSAEPLFFSYLSREIYDLHTRYRVDLKKMAILVKDRYQQERLKGHLLEKGIAFVSKNQQSIAESDAAWALLEFFQALFSVEDHSSIRRALIGPLMNWSFQEMLLDFEESLGYILSKLASLRDLLEKEGVSHFFRALLSSVWRKDQPALLETLVSRKDLSFYTDMEMVFDLLQNHERQRGSSESAILSFFEELRKDFPPEEERNAPPEGVQIMTLHAAKGLEFDVVFALGLASSSPFFEEEESALEEDAEKMRQFYVALTRAKIRSYVPFIWEEDGQIKRGKASASDLFCSHVLTDSGREGKISFSAFLQKMQPLKEEGQLSYEIVEKILHTDPPKVEEAELFPPPHIFLQKSSLRAYSFSSLSPFEIERKEDLFFDENYLFSPHVFPQGREMGVWMHRIFEKVFSSERGKSIGAIIDDELLGDPLGKYSKKAKEMVECALGTPLEIQGSSFSLQEVERKNLFAEMEFLFTLDPSLDLMKGSIDLLFFHRGKYYFVDWKTHWLGDSLEFYQTSHLQKAMEEHHYFLQAAIYKQAAMRLVEKMKSPVSFGGAFYIFLRGLTPEKKKNQGVFAFFPEHLNRDSSLCLQPLLV